MNRRQCAYCGTFVAEGVKQCPDCREAIPDRVEVPKPPPEGWPQIRRGLLYMMLGGVAYYLTSPQSEMHIPFAIPPVVTTYLLPIVFLLGLGFTIFGVARRIGLV